MTGSTKHKWSRYLSSHVFDVISKVVSIIGVLSLFASGAGFVHYWPRLYDGAEAFMLAKGFLLAIIISFIVVLLGGLLVHLGRWARRDA